MDFYFFNETQCSNFTFSESSLQQKIKLSNAMFMKKSTFLLAAMLISIGLFSQHQSQGISRWELQKEDAVPPNELKFNLATTIFGSAPEVSYERILDTDISVGASLGAGFNPHDYPIQLHLTPYFRWFFGGNRKTMDRAGAVFFIEVNGSLFSHKEGTRRYEQSNIVLRDNKSQFGAGLGLALGWKYLSKNNWVGELLFGGGRNLADTDSYLDTYPRFAISIGKRF